MPILVKGRLVITGVLDLGKVENSGEKQSQNYSGSWIYGEIGNCEG